MRRRLKPPRSEPGGAGTSGSCREFEGGALIVPRYSKARSLAGTGGWTYMPCMHAVVLLGALGVVEALQRADQIAGNAADALKTNCLPPGGRSCGQASPIMPL